MTSNEIIKSNEFEYVRTSWHRGYISRLIHEGIVTPYKGRYGEGYTIDHPSWDSTAYFLRDYYVKKVV